jgi:hypothetical protein
MLKVGGPHLEDDGLAAHYTWVGASAFEVPSPTVSAVNRLRDSDNAPVCSGVFTPPYRAPYTITIPNDLISTSAPLTSLGQRILKQCMRGFWVNIGNLLSFILWVQMHLRWAVLAIDECRTPDFHRKSESLYHRDSP